MNNGTLAAGVNAVADSAQAARPAVADETKAKTVRAEPVAGRGVAARATTAMLTAGGAGTRAAAGIGQSVGLQPQ